MKIKTLSILATAALFVVFTFTAHAQLKLPAASPKQTLEQAFGTSTIKIEYSRPGVKDRVIFGGLVPYGKMWRTGANASTRITFGEDVKIEGMPLAAGSYSLLTLPNADSWDIMFYKDINLGANMADYKQENELLKIHIKPTALTDKVETFTINVTDIKPSTANIQLTWDKTSVAFGVAVDEDATIMKNIQTTMANDSRPFFQSAQYYYDNNKDLNQAIEWVNQAIAQNPKAAYMTNLKAKIQFKMKDYDGAIKTAEQSIQQSKDSNSDEFVAANQQIIADSKKAK